MTDKEKLSILKDIIGRGKHKPIGGFSCWFRPEYVCPKKIDNSTWKCLNCKELFPLVLYINANMHSCPCRSSKYSIRGVTRKLNAEIKRLEKVTG